MKFRSWFLMVMLAAVAHASDSAGLSDEQRNALPEYFGFGEMQMYRIKPGIRLLRIADLNRDGRNDVVLWNAYQNRFELFYQPAPGDPPPPQAKLDRNEITDRGNLRKETVPVAYRVAAFEVADVTGDQIPDLVFFGEPTELVVLPGHKDGQFGPAVGLRAPDGAPRSGVLAVADFNGDGREDVALLGDAILQVFHQKADGGLAKPIRIAHAIKSPLLMLAADVNGDGRSDLVISADDDQYGAYVIVQQSNGTLGAIRRCRLPKLRSMTFARVGQQDDLFAIQYVTGRMLHYRWEAPELAATEEWTQRLFTYPAFSKAKRQPFAIGDINGDGLPDCITALPEAAQILVFAQGSAGLDTADIYPGLLKTTDLQVCDVDGDGRNELLSVSVEEKLIGVSRFENGRLSFPTPLSAQGQPQAARIGSLVVGGAADRLAYLTKEGGGYKLIIRPTLGEAPDITVEIDELSEEPAGLRFADVNQDGRNDLLLFVRFSALQTFLQQEDGTFRWHKGSDARSDLVREAPIEGFGMFDVDGDGKPELVLAQKTFARALTVRDGRWTVVDQLNPESADAQITGLTALSGGTSPRMAMYDRKSRDLLVLESQPDRTFVVTRTMPVGNIDLIAMETLAGAKPEQTCLLLPDTSSILTLWPFEKSATFIEQHAYESDVRDAYLADAVVGDLNHDGVRDVAVIDIRKATIDIATTAPDGGYVRATRFQVFQGKRFSATPDRGGEPHEVLCGDVTGDGVDDLVMLVHDRLLILPGE